MDNNNNIFVTASEWLRAGTDDVEWEQLASLFEQAAIITLTALILTSYLSLVALSLMAVVLRNYG